MPLSQSSQPGPVQPGQPQRLPSRDPSEGGPFSELPFLPPSSGRKRIAVLYGGRAEEHPISCISAGYVLQQMDPEKYEAVPIGITREGIWITGGDDPRQWKLGAGQLPAVEEVHGSRRVVLDVSLQGDGFFAKDAETGRLGSLGHIDAVFPVLHGTYGEDGTVQGLLSMMGVPFVGCGVLASAACMDKHYTKVILEQAGIPVAPGITLDTRSYDAGSRFEQNGFDLLMQVEEAGLEYPLFVKPSRSGSSFGVTKINYDDDSQARTRKLVEAVYEASQHDWRVLVEQGIDAREIECAVFSPRRGQAPQTAFPGEIVLDKPEEDTFYDFDSKYMDAQASHVEIPAHLPQDILDKVRQVTAKAFLAVDGEGLSRVDTFVMPDGTVMVNEINTLPGFTLISMYAKAWEATGISSRELIGSLIEGVLQQADSKSAYNV
ncbi:MAG: D-alanine--D-alanine ligase family protein [Scardovia wiggsiae]|uniref:D-alanine--D-alanine ligase family protein n=1 Tax=Scardovia wiggsiae TaxID=230143 RepID=UPI00360D404D